jgi:hypothetical protein
MVYALAAMAFNLAIVKLVYEFGPVKKRASKKFLLIIF